MTDLLPLPHLPATLRLYLQDSMLDETLASLLVVRGQELAFDQTVFFPGGGGQPPDQGWLDVAGQHYPIATSRSDEDQTIWHQCTSCPADLQPGLVVKLVVNFPRRNALNRYHTALHILNHQALHNYQAFITGVQIGVEGSRIDFNFPGLTPALCRELEAQVNQVIQADLPVRSYYISETEFNQRPDLRRTRDVLPPVHAGKVRLVEINDFDAQACGGTHVASTAELGVFSILRTDNKGRQNKRIYVQLQIPD